MPSGVSSENCSEKTHWFQSPNSLRVCSSFLPSFSPAVPWCQTLSFACGLGPEYIQLLFSKLHQGTLLYKPHLSYTRPQTHRTVSHVSIPQGGVPHRAQPCGSNFSNSPGGGNWVLTSIGQTKIKSGMFWFTKLVNWSR